MNETNPTPPIPENPPVPPPLESPLAGQPDLRTLFEALLRHPAALARRLGEPDHRATAKLAGLALGSAVVFGLVIGTFAMHDQLWAAPLKIAAGMLIAALICFPSLYIFGSLAGARASTAHLAACLAGALALAGLLLLGFAPAVWIFTQSTDSLGFMGFLALAAWAVSLGFGLGFLFRALRAAGADRSGPVAVWAIIFILVTLQMTTSLRPILGRSDQFLTSEKRFFLQHWAETAGDSLGKPTQTTRTTPEATPTTEPKPGESTAPESSENPYYRR